MEARNEGGSVEGVLDQLPQPVCGCDARGNCHHQCLLEVYGAQEVIFFVLWYLICCDSDNPDYPYDPFDSSVSYDRLQGIITTKSISNKVK